MSDCEITKSIIKKMFNTCNERLCKNPNTDYITGFHCNAENLQMFTESFREIEKVLQQNSIYKQALEDISDPFGYLKRFAEKEGCKIDGQNAVRFAEDANNLKDFAKKALNNAKDIIDGN